MLPLESILIVEDEPDIQAIARLALEKVGGFRVKVAGSGKEGITTARATTPDLILLDVMMPGQDGPSILQALRTHAETQAIPVIFLTAKVQPHELNYYSSLGAIGVIAKPFDPMDLARLVREIWESSHAHSD